MRKVHHLQDKWRKVVFGLIGLLIVVADQLSKAWIRTNLLEGQSLFETGFFRITRLHNTGAAFGLFQGQSLLLTVITLIVVAILLVYGFIVYHRFPLFGNLLDQFAFGLVMGGAVGNLIDRIRLSYVIDFIDFGFWPTFNIADSAVTVGVIILICSLLHLARIEKC